MERDTSRNKKSTKERFPYTGGMAAADFNLAAMKRYANKYLANSAQARKERIQEYQRLLTAVGSLDIVSQIDDVVRHHIKIISILDELQNDFPELSPGFV